MTTPGGMGPGVWAGAGYTAFPGPHRLVSVRAIRQKQFVIKIGVWEPRSRPLWKLGAPSFENNLCEGVLGTQS